MNETLELPVHYKEEDLLLKMEMIKWGYTHRFKIDLNGTVYFFEPDEEGTYRALTEDRTGHQSVNDGLLRAIGKTLDELMK